MCWLDMTSQCAGGEQYLDTQEGSLYWWQLHLLDVCFVLAAGAVLLSLVLLVIVYLLYLAVRRGLRHARSTKAKAH